MKFSLIMGTVGRFDELACFLASLDSQTHRDFELIVVDQNEDDRLVPLLRSYDKKFAVCHLRSPRGLSRARNVGLKHIDGAIVSFPDDDCWYPIGLLETVAAFLEANGQLDGVTGRFMDDDGQSEGRWLDRSALLTKYNVWRAAISFTIFLRRRVTDSTGQFNEELGVGAGTPWGASEETDYLLRSLRCGFKIEYLRRLIVHHPVKTKDFDESARARQGKYEAGIGRVIRINEYPYWYFPAVCMRTMGGALLALMRGDFPKACFKVVSLLARVKGWRGI